MDLNELNKWTKNTAAINRNRSCFTTKPTQITTLKAGDIIPILAIETIPGATIKGNLTYILRELTPALPVMDNSVIDFYCFWESYENLSLTYKNIVITEDGEDADFEQFCGENKTGYWAQEQKYKLNKKRAYMNDEEPEIEEEADGYNAPQSVLNYLGVPSFLTERMAEIGNTISGEELANLSRVTKTNIPQINLWQPAMLDAIYNDWFRNENVEAPTEWAQLERIETLNKDGTTDGWRGNEYPYKANIIGYHQNDLPEPVEGEEFTFNLGIEAPVEIPVDTTLTTTTTNQVKVNHTFTGNEDSIQSLTPWGADTEGGVWVSPEEATTPNYSYKLYVDNPNYSLKTTLTGTADLTGATALTIADLRNAIAIQHMQEKFARSGSRYIEFLQAFYGVKPSNRNLRRPEYLGGQRDPINIQQVVSSTQTTETDMGELGAYSHSSGHLQNFFNKSFDEWGVLMVVAVIRTIKKDVFGIDKHLTKEYLTDLYIPELENIGDQAVYKTELDIFHGKQEDKKVFGYEPRYDEYKKIKDSITGYANPSAGDEILSRYTYQTHFEGEPYLDENYMKQDFRKVGKTLINENTLSQFLLNTAFDITITAPMKEYAIPGLDKI